MTSIRHEYLTKGVDAYYKDNSDDYANPHYTGVIECLKTLRYQSYCDLACGYGLASQVVSPVYGIDKYLFERYTKETGNVCYPYSFRDIAFDYSLSIPDAECCVISYAFDIIPNDIRDLFLFRLSLNFKYLVLLRPNRKIENHSNWCFDSLLKIDKTVMTTYVRK